MTLTELVRYFLYLGAFGFGGPVALVGFMHRDLVEQRRWITEGTYKLSLALAQIMPGPLAAQTAIAIGYFEGGILGATLVGLGFVTLSNTRDRAFARAGIDAKGVILSAKQTGTYVNELPQIALRIRVEHSDRPPYEVEHRAVVSLVSIAALQPGAVLEQHGDEFSAGMEQVLAVVQD